jgi:hypothetical protein
MGIINRLKGLIFGVKSAPAKQVPEHAVPRSRQALSKTIDTNQPRLSDNDERVVLLSIQGQLRVINESIEIARKSKKFDTKISRLGVARKTLKMAREQAAQFHLEVEGFVQAEAAINKIQEALESGAPEILDTPVIPLDMSISSAARDLLKEATVLKKEKKYAEACATLREAYSADGSENLMIEERLRLPMYLLLAGRNDEGWEELNRLDSQHIDQFSQPIIAHQMRVFCKKEGKDRVAAPELQKTEITGQTVKIQAEEVKPVGMTIGDMQAKPLSEWGNSDIIIGLIFCATLQLRTPLRILLRHDEVHSDPNTAPPIIALEGWEGIWTLQLTKTPMQSRIASDAGSVLAKDYLPFLLAIRKVVEAHDSIERRINHLRETSLTNNWKVYVEKYGRYSKNKGMERVIADFFPRFIDTIPKITAEAIEELARLGLVTPNEVAFASDKTLLGIKGIGRVKLKTIRDYTAGITENRDAERLDLVAR